MLTGEIDAGILPWEIFIDNLLTLPRQQDRWAVPLFLHPGPTEFVAGPSMGFLTKSGCPGKMAKAKAITGKLRIGVESGSSLTREQVKAWTERHDHQLRLDFKMLPMELMEEALRKEAVDGLVAPTPWGLKVEDSGLGKVERNFDQGRFKQDVVLVQSRASAPTREEAAEICRRVNISRQSFREREEVIHAAGKMAACGNPKIASSSMISALEAYPSFLGEPDEYVPDVDRLVLAFEDWIACVGPRFDEGKLRQLAESLGI
ncbi:MAG: hypothetical protein QM680_11115 [Luteolibacter sp.]